MKVLRQYFGIRPHGAVCTSIKNKPYVCVIGDNLLLRRRRAPSDILVEVSNLIRPRFAAGGGGIRSRHRAEGQLRDVILLPLRFVVRASHGGVEDSGETRGVSGDLGLDCGEESRQNAYKKQFSREGTPLKYSENGLSWPKRKRIRKVGGLYNVDGRVQRCRPSSSRRFDARSTRCKPHPRESRATKKVASAPLCSRVIPKAGWSHASHTAIRMAGS
jgi:hypothetical protein